MADRSVALKEELIKSLDEDKSKISERLQKANELLKDFTFKRYDSDCICTKHVGLSSESFNEIVDSIIDSYGLEDKFKSQIKNLEKGEKNATKFLKVHEAKEDGDVIYGKFAVLKNGTVLDMAYAMYTASYEFEPVKITSKPNKFLGITWSYTETSEYQYPHVPATESFMRAFFENKAIEALKDEY